MKGVPPGMSKSPVIMTNDVEALPNPAPSDDSCLEYTFELSSTPPDLITVAMDTQHSGKEGRITG